MPQNLISEKQLLSLNKESLKYSQILPRFSFSFYSFVLKQKLDSRQKELIKEIMKLGPYLDIIIEEKLDQTQEKINLYLKEKDLKIINPSNKLEEKVLSIFEQILYLLKEEDRDNFMRFGQQIITELNNSHWKKFNNFDEFISAKSFPARSLFLTFENQFNQTLIQPILSLSIILQVIDDLQDKQQDELAKFVSARDFLSDQELSKKIDIESEKFVSGIANYNPRLKLRAQIYINLIKLIKIVRVW